MSFEEYFSGSIQYPNPTETMLEPGILHEYLSSTFLTGWINYVKITAAFLITRYRKHSVNAEAADRFNERPEKLDYHHTDVGDAPRDDVLILAKSTSGHWWFFWNDRDCSDCMIGRFMTPDKDTEVIQSFAEYANERSLDLSKQYAGRCEQNPDEDTSENKEGMPALELYPHCFGGWVRF